MFAILVQSRGHAYRIGKDETHDVSGMVWYQGIRMEPPAISLLQELESDAMAGFRFESK
jgi:hypothetical protein